MLQNTNKSMTREVHFHTCSELAQAGFGCRPGKPCITKSFRYLKWEPHKTHKAILGWVFSYTSRIHTAYICEDSSSLGS